MFNEAWWLIERKPFSNETPGNKFFTGKDWSNSALVAARFKTKQDAQSVIENYITENSALGSPISLCGYAFAVEHMWSY